MASFEGLERAGEGYGVGVEEVVGETFGEDDEVGGEVSFEVGGRGWRAFWVDFEGEGGGG